MPFNPFNSNSEGSSFEQGNPISNAVKKPVQAASAAAVQQAKQQSQSFVDQLYGNTAPQPEDGTNEDSTPNPQQANQRIKSAGGSQAALAQQASQAKTPQEQSQIEEARKKLQELQGQHKSEYFDKTFGEGEYGRKKREQEEEQEKQMKAQEEEEKQQQEEQEKQAQEESMAAMAPQGKGSKGRNRMTPPPLSVRQSQTKAESNRGTTG